MKFPRKISLLLAVLLLALAAIAAAIIYGGPVRPPVMDSIDSPFKGVDFSKLPPLSTYPAADGRRLAYRDYVPAASPAAGSVVLVHGSSASSNSMHPMALALAAKGLRVYALDMRGHGGSGTKGRIDFIGQLESDLEAFVRAAKPAAPATLVGFSAGGGFVLRVAGSPQQTMFDSYLLLSPFLSQSAANQRPDSGGWASIGMPRIIGLVALNRVGVDAFNHLPVTSFALSEPARAMLTPEYDFNLALNFRPERDYEANIRNAKRPVAVVAGTDDEVFRTERLEAIFKDLGKNWPVMLVPGVRHIPLTLEPAALDATVRQVQELQRRAS
ncbi:MAG: alpha/beta hydrolase [Ramlibacter sp.]|nr:alpha/beta hydrolase [Ramlibacter sp.]